MSKKKRKKERKRHQANQAKTIAQKTKKEEEISEKKPKKILISIVALIFYAENSLPQGKVVKSRVRLIDIMHSILDMLEIPMSEEIQGISLLPYIEGREKDDLSSYIETFCPRENCGWSELIGLIDRDWKYIQAPKEELYNLKKDPEEEENAINREKKLSRT